jgi:hypothetical protein
MNTERSNRKYYNPEMDIRLSMINFLSIIIGNFSMSTSKSKLSIIMVVYIGMYLAGIIYNLNFVILIVN